MQIRVLIDITKPLRRVVKLHVGAEKICITTAVRYEILPDFCYGCGVLGHVFRECNEIVFDPEMEFFAYPYGPWLRADEVGFSSQMPRRTFSEFSLIGREVKGGVALGATVGEGSM